MSISSLVVRVDPSHAPSVHDCISRITHTEVTDRLGDAFVVLNRNPEADAHRAVFDTLSRTQGVMNVDLVFHAFDDSSDPAEE